MWLYHRVISPYFGELCFCDCRHLIQIFILYSRTDEACNHVAALLETIVDITNKKKDGTLSSTSRKCKWNNPRKRKLSPKKAQDLTFSRKKTINKNLNEEMTVMGISGKDLGIQRTFNEEKFKKKLKENKSNAGWLTLFEKQDVQELTVPKLTTVSFMYNDSVDLENEEVKQSFQNTFDKLSVTDQDAVDIEKLTRGQNKNKQWYEARSQRITASNFGCIAKMKDNTKPDTILKDVMGYRTFDNKYCAWGRSHEPAARRMYSNNRKNVKVQQCGLIVNPKFPHLGASPDGLLSTGDSSEGQGLLEIKCPAAERWKNEDPRTCAIDSDFFCTLDKNGEIKLKRSHRYYYQI